MTNLRAVPFFLAIMLLGGFSHEVKSQCVLGITEQVGFNRIGLYFDTGVSFGFKRNLFTARLRHYGPDYVFEKNTPGLSLGYSTIFYAENWYFGPGLNAAVFHENKSTSRLTLAELIFQMRLGRNLTDRLVGYTTLGIGSVINRYTGQSTISSATSGYINYEFSLGVTYYWRISDRNTD